MVNKKSLLNMGKTFFFPTNHFIARIVLQKNIKMEVILRARKQETADSGL